MKAVPAALGDGKEKGEEAEEKGEEEEAGGCASRFSLRSVDPCQRVTARTVNVSQISPARSGVGETIYVSTPGRPLLSVSANARKLMRPLWVTMGTRQK